MFSVASLTRAAKSAIRSTAPDRKSTRLNSSHHGISYGVFCLEIHRDLQRRRAPHPGPVRPMARAVLAAGFRCFLLFFLLRPLEALGRTLCPLFFLNDRAPPDTYPASLDHALPF